MTEWQAFKFKAINGKNNLVLTPIGKIAYSQADCIEEAEKLLNEPIHYTVLPIRKKFINEKPKEVPTKKEDGNGEG